MFLRHYADHEDFDQITDQWINCAQKMSALAAIMDLQLARQRLLCDLNSKQQRTSQLLLLSDKITLLLFEYLGHFREMIKVFCHFQIANRTAEWLLNPRATNSLWERDCPYQLMERFKEPLAILL